MLPRRAACNQPHGRVEGSRRFSHESNESEVDDRVVIGSMMHKATGIRGWCWIESVGLRGGYWGLSSKWSIWPYEFRPTDATESDGAGFVTEKRQQAGRSERCWLDGGMAFVGWYRC